MAEPVTLRPRLRGMPPQQAFIKGSSVGLISLSHLHFAFFASLLPPLPVSLSHSSLSYLPCFYFTATIWVSNI